jgi:hypothetical protein
MGVLGAILHAFCHVDDFIKCEALKDSDFLDGR